MTPAHPLPRPVRLTPLAGPWRVEPSSERWPAILCVAVIVGLSTALWAAIAAAGLALFGLLQ